MSTTEDDGYDDVDHVNTAVSRLLIRAVELSRSQLEGIEEAAHELVGMTAGDVRVIMEARRFASSCLSSDATTENKQVVSLIRRAVEVGMSQWSMEDTRLLS